MIINETLTKKRIKFLKKVEILSKKALDYKFIKGWYYNGDQFVITIKYPLYNGD